MSTTLLPPHSQAGTGDGAGNRRRPARRAVMRWGWRLFRREWRQQLLVLGLLAMAVAATIWGAGVATNTPPRNPNYATFGSALAMATLPGSDPHLAADIAQIQRNWGPADVIEIADISTGSTQYVQLRAQDPHGLYSGPMVGLVSGGYPAGPGQVALTSQAATLYDAHTGGTWRAAGTTWRVTGIVQDPSNLLDEFALVGPGQVMNPSQVIMLLGSPAVRQAIGNAHHHPRLTGFPAAATLTFPDGTSAGVPPATIVLVIAVIGLVFIGLVAVAGFSVMGQRRLRALGMLSAIGATEKNVRLVMIVNGAAVGIAAAIVGAVLGFAAWFTYVPTLQQDTGHQVSATNLPWWAVGTGIVLAVLTSVLASRHPAKAMARVPVVAALSGRPAPPKAVHRSVVPGVCLFAGGVVCLAFSGGWAGNSGSDALFLLVGLIAVIIGIFLLAPLCIRVLAAGAGPRMPVAIRIALRDLVRYRTRSGAALAATTFAVFLAMLICVVASIRFEKVLDWTGPNLSGSQVLVYTLDRDGGTGLTSTGLTSTGPTSAQLASLGRQVDSYAAGLHAQVLPLDTADAHLYQVGTQDNNFSGTVFVATPQLLATYGIKASQINPGTDILTMRPGMAGLPNMIMFWGGYGQDGADFGGGPRAGSPPPCTLSNNCLTSPVMQTIGSLPDGTSAPNTVVTEYAVTKYHLQPQLSRWLIQAPEVLTAAQINAARELALANGVTVETKSGELGLSEIADGATTLGIVIALGVLAMSVGLIRSETRRDLRTLAATGASVRIRRTITAATAAALGLLGAVLGMAGAVVAGLAWARSSVSATFGDVPVDDIVILLIGLPLIAAVGGWLLAGREPELVSRQPLE